MRVTRRPVLKSVVLCSIGNDATTWRWRWRWRVENTEQTEKRTMWKLTKWNKEKPSGKDYEIVVRQKERKCRQQNRKSRERKIFRRKWQSPP